MASGDAKPLPIKNQALRLTIPILDADGDLVTGAASLDSEVSLDGGAFADCTNEAVEIGSSGLYTLDMTAAELNADTVVVIVKTGTAGAKTTPIILYPQSAGDLPVTIEASGITTGSFSSGAINAAAIASDAITAAKIASDAITAAKIASDAITAAKIATDAITAAKIAADAIGASELAADAVTEIQNGLATASAVADVQTDTNDLQTRLPASLVSGRIDASVGAMAANTLTATAIASDAITAAKIAADAITAAKIAADAIGASELAADAVTEIQAAVAAGAVASVTGNVGGNVAGSVGGIASGGIAAASFAAGAIDAAAIATNAITSVELAASAVTEIQAAVAAGAVASVTGAVGSVTGNVGGNVTGSVGSLAAQAKATSTRRFSMSLLPTPLPSRRQPGGNVQPEGQDRLALYAGAEPGDQDGHDPGRSERRELGQHCYRGNF